MKKTLTPDSYQYIEGVAKASDSGHGKLGRFVQSSLLMDLLSCVLLSAGLGFAALTLTSFNGGFWSCFGLAAASTLMLALFSLQWWIAPATVAGTAAIAALYLVLTGGREAAVSYWTGFFVWMSQGANYDRVYSESAGEVVFKAAIIFVIALSCFILIRRLFLLPVIFLFTSTCLCLIFYLGRADLSVSLCVCAAGMIILLPRTYSRYVSLRSGEKGGDEKRGAMQVVAVPAAVLAILSALWFIPEDTSEWRSRGLNNLIADVAYMFEGPFRSYPSSASNFSMGKLGFEQENGILGGPVQLTDERFLSVNAARPMLLRGAVMDYYTGESWRVGGADGDFRYDSIFWQGYRRDAFGLNKPLGGEAMRLFEALTVEESASVNYQSMMFSTIFVGGILRDADFEKDNVLESIYFNMRSEMYLHYLVPRMAILDLKTRVWDTGLPGFEESFLRLEELAANRGDKNFSAIKERYTRLPNTLPENVRELALEITAEKKSPYQKARAIESWLGGNCEYTLEPIVPPQDTDFVGHFLSTKEGYCTYYASAMAVLARCVGLPSRYVTGFGLERDQKSASLFTATGKTAHAWAEIYFDGIGWIEFDPLNWNPSEPLNQEQADLQTSQQQPVVTPPQDLPEKHAPEESTGQDIPARNTGSSRQILSSVAAAAVLYFLAWLGIRRIMSRKLRIYEFSRVSRKLPDLGNRLDFYFDDILKQLSLLGIDAFAGETLTAFSARVDRRLKLEDINFDAAAKALMNMHFAEAAPSIDDCKAAFQYHRELESALRERMGKAAYFFKRVIRR